MKRDITLWQLCGFAFVSLLGTLLHFLYEWTDENILASFFSGVNESTWEHMKLLFWPAFIFALVQSRYFSEYKSYWFIKLCGILTGLALIPIIFYTYNGAIGKSPDWLNITIFFVSAAGAFLAEYRMLKKGRRGCQAPRAALFAICILGLAFIFFTLNPPPLPLFKNPDLI